MFSFIWSHVFTSPHGVRLPHWKRAGYSCAAHKEQQATDWSTILYFGHRPLLQHVAQFRPQPSQHLILDLTQGPRRHAEFTADVVRRSTLDGDQPERLPGAVFEFAADQLQPAAKQVTGVLRVEGSVSSAFSSGSS